MLSSVYSAGLAGIDGFIVTVESDAKERIPMFELVGLPDAAVKEAKERVRAACENSGFLFPSLSLTVGLPIAAVNLLLNVLPTLALRYNTPMLQGMLRRMQKREKHPPFPTKSTAFF